MSAVKVTLEFASAEAAIVALAKIHDIKTPAAAPKAEVAPPQPVGVAQPPAPTVEKPARKPRADKGQQREPYGPRQNANAAVEAGTSEARSGPGAAGAQAAVTDPGKAAEQAANPTSTVPPVAPATQPAASAAPVAAQAPAAPTPPAAAVPPPGGMSHGAAEKAPVPSADEVQKAVEKIFGAKGFDITQDLLGRFGVKRGRDLPEDQRANFINRVNGVVDRGEAV